jgi:hypothetical protein
MARGGKRAGAGRKPVGNVAMLVRVRPEIRSAFERLAKHSGQSLSSVVERHLEAALAAPRGKGETRAKALGYLIGQLPMIALSLERENDSPEFDWQINRFDFEALKAAVNQLLDKLAPRGQAGKSRYPGEETPEAAGRSIVSILFALLNSPRGELYAMGDARDAKAGTPFYAIPQAARDLGLGGKS